ncbi:VRR-NUC domain-containing protein [Staphylococcus chromogenes]|uniref:VRR-NUC domain-containing protein n=1 Tax=Staphylococcus chromogenes TaxID=46126 RepID=UPI003AFFA317
MHESNIEIYVLKGIEKFVRESKIENYMRGIVEKNYGLFLKFVAPGKKGVPDRIVILPENRIYFVELKNEVGRLSAIQKYVHKQFKKCGVDVYVISSKQEVDDFCREVLHIDH